MPETVNLLETALDNEAALLLKLISSLENDDIYEFARRLAELAPRSGTAATNEILHVAHNIKTIEAAVEAFYVA